jgi:hypothetical protein
VVMGSRGSRRRCRCAEVVYTTLAGIVEMT